jgi:small-conductance mechanosensitive channel
MRVFRTLFLLLVLVLAVPAPLSAQDPAPEKTDEPAEEETKPEAIPITELSSRLAADQLRLREIEEAAAPLADNRTIIDQIDALGETLAERRAQFEGRPIKSYSLRTLEETRAKWKRMGTEVGRWEKGIADRLTELDGFDQEINSMRTSWREALEDPRAQEFPEAIVNQIRQVLAEADGTDEAVSKRTEFVLGRQKQVTGFRVDINDVIRTLDNAADEKRGDLFTLDSPALWSLVAGDTTGASTREVPVEGRERHGFGQSSTAFFLQYSGRITAHLLLTILLALFVRRLRRSAFTFESEDVELQNALRLLKRPLAAAIVLLWLSPARAYPDAPFAVFEILAVIALVAAFRLVPWIVPRPVVRPVYAVFLIAVLEHLNTVIASSAIVHRLNTIGITSLMLALIVWWNVRGERRANLPSSWASFLWMLRPLAWLLAGSLIALVIGASALGELCSYGFIFAVFTGLVLYVALRTFEAVFGLLLLVHGDRFPRFISQHHTLFERRVSRVIRLAVLAWWLFISLEEFRLFQPVWEQIQGLATRQWALGQVTFSIAGILVFFAVLWVAAMLSRFIRFVLQEDVLPRLPLRRGLPNTILLMVNYGIMAVGIVLAMATLGLETSEFTVIAGALGVGVGFGLQTLVNNFVSGLILMFERPIQIGDTVEVGSLTGAVKRIGIRASVIRTWSGAEVIVPNGDLVSGQVINWTLSDLNRRLELEVGVAYGSDPERVIEVLMKCVDDNPHVLEEPAPMVLFHGFGDSSLNFELRAWTGDPAWWILASELRVKMYAALNEAGITIPFPQRDLHIRSVTDEAADALHKDRPDG